MSHLEKGCHLQKARRGLERDKGRPFRGINTFWSKEHVEELGDGRDFVGKATAGQVPADTVRDRVQSYKIRSESPVVIWKSSEGSPHPPRPVSGSRSKMVS